MDEKGLANGETVTTSPNDTLRVIRQEVTAAVDAKIAEYRRLATAFLSGLFIFVVLLFGDHFWLNDKVLNFVREELIPFGPQLNKFLGNSVAFSYTNEYWIQAPAFEQEQLAFFARKPQSVKALIQVLHRGSGERLPVSIGLDQMPLLPSGNTTEDLLWDTIDLTTKLWTSSVLTPAAPADVHYLVFRVDKHDLQTDDRVFIRVLVNVIGLEDREP